MVWALGRNRGCRMRSRDRRRGSGRRNAVWPLRSNRSGCGRSRERRGGSGRGHVVGTLWSDGVSRVGPRISGKSIRPGNLRGYPCRTIVHKRRGQRAPQPQSRERRCMAFRMQRKRSKTRETRPRTHLCRWRHVCAAGGFPGDARSRRRGVSRRGRIEFVGKARKLPDVGKIPRRSVINAPIANGLLGVFMLVVMIFTHLDIFDHSGGIFGENRQRAIERNQVGRNCLVVDAHEAHRQAHALFSRQSRLI